MKSLGGPVSPAGLGGSRAPADSTKCIVKSLHILIKRRLQKSLGLESQRELVVDSQKSGRLSNECTIVLSRRFQIKSMTGKTGNQNL